MQKRDQRRRRQRRFLRLIYRELAATRLPETDSPDSPDKLIRWVEQTYGFVADTLAYCAALRQISLRPDSRILTFFHEMLDADTRARDLLDTNEICKTISGIPLTEDTYLTIIHVSARFDIQRRREDRYILATFLLQRRIAEFDKYREQAARLAKVS